MTVKFIERATEKAKRVVVPEDLLKEVLAAGFANCMRMKPIINTEKKKDR